MPNPRKLMNASRTMLPAMPNVKATTIGPTALGSRWRRMMRAGGTPSARADSVNCISRSDRNWLRTIRAMDCQLRKPKIIAM